MVGTWGHLGPGWWAGVFVPRRDLLARSRPDRLTHGQWRRRPSARRPRA